MNKRNILIGCAVLIVIILAIILWQSRSSISDLNLEGLNGSTTEVIQGSATSSVTKLAVKNDEMTKAVNRLVADWAWRQTKHKNAGSLTPKANKPFTVTFAKDGTVTVQGDCNTLTGSFTLAENTISAEETIDELATGKITITPLASTKKACSGSQETIFARDLESVKTYYLRVSELELQFAPGTGAMFFSHKINTQGQ